MVRTNAAPSLKGITAARCQIAWEARTSGDWDTWREVMRHLGSLHEQQQREGRKLDAAGRAQRFEAKNSPPAQTVRLAEQRVRAESQRLPKSEAQQQECDRNLIRWRAEAVCEALWSLNDGDRSWEAVSIRSTLLPTHSSDVEMTGRRSGPQRLTVLVPELSVLQIEKHTLDLYRAEYDALLTAWGYTYTSMRKVGDTKRANRGDECPSRLGSRQADPPCHECLRQPAGTRVGMVELSDQQPDAHHLRVPQSKPRCPACSPPEWRPAELCPRVGEPS